MSMDEEAINSVKEYFDSIAQNAVDVVYGAIGSDTTFAEFMDAVSLKINQFSSELVASEVLNLSPGIIENFNGGDGLYTDDVQEIIDNEGIADIDDDLD